MTDQSTDAERGVDTSRSMNAWPDPAKIGVPLNPERKGWHWLEWCNVLTGKPTGSLFAYRWERDGWWDGAMHRHARHWSNWRYLGPCFTPDELLAERDALRAEMAAAVAAERDALRAEMAAAVAAERDALRRS